MLGLAVSICSSTAAVDVSERLEGTAPYEVRVCAHETVYTMCRFMSIKIKHGVCVERNTKLNKVVQSVFLRIRFPQTTSICLAKEMFYFMFSVALD